MLYIGFLDFKRGKLPGELKGHEIRSAMASAAPNAPASSKGGASVWLEGGPKREEPPALGRGSASSSSSTQPPGSACRIIPGSDPKALIAWENALKSMALTLSKVVSAYEIVEIAVQRCDQLVLRHIFVS